MFLQLPVDKLNLSFCISNTQFNINQLSFGTYRCSIGKHKHGNNYFELHLLTNGEGKVIVPQGSFSLNKGTLYMTGSVVEHQQIINEDFPMQEYCIGFEANKLRDEQTPLWLDYLLNVEFEIGYDKKQTCLKYFDQIETEIAGRKVGYLEMVRNIITSIFIEFIRAVSEDMKEGKGNQPYVEKRSYIIDNCMLFEYRTITEKELAQTLNLSVRQLQRYLKDTYNQTFLQMRTKARINKACELLEQGCSLAQAAELVGYGNGNYLKKLLKNSPVSG